jgi:hypothetical protein
MQSLLLAGVGDTDVKVNEVTLTTWVVPESRYEIVTTAVPAVLEDSRSCESIEIVVSWTCAVGNVVAANTLVPPTKAPRLVVMLSCSTTGVGAMKARVISVDPSAGALVTSAQYGTN